MLHVTPRRVQHAAFACAAALALACASRPAAAGLATDAVVPVDAGTAATSITTAAFATHQPNELLLAFIATDGPTTRAMSVTGVTGGGLTWTLVRRTNAQLGTSEVWRAFATAPLTGATVRAALAQSVVASMTVVSFTGADPSGTGGSGAIGATAGANAPSGAPAASLVATRANSWTWGVGNDWDNAVPRTVPAPQVKVHEYLAPTGDTFWMQRQGSVSVAAGATVTINDTAPTADRYNLTIVEVLPATGTGSTIAGAIGPGAAGVGVLVTLSGGATLTTSTDVTGAFAFGGLANGTYTVTPSRAGYTFDPPSTTVVVSGADVTGLTFTATALPTYALSGAIVPATAGAGAIVSLGGSPSAVTSADANGAYAFAGLLPGTYTVTPSRSGYVFTPASASVTITASDVTSVNFTAAPAPPPPLLAPNLQDFIPAAGFAVAGTGAARVLQYTHDTFNGGPGPLVIQPTYNPASGNYQGVQYVYVLNGNTWTIQKRIPVAGAFVFHAAHGHFHFPFASYGLYGVAPGGGVGAPVALSPKTGFCIADSYIYAPALPNAGALGNLGSCSDPTALRGLDIGAVDEYDKSDPGQSIPLSGVANGTYWFKAVVDPENFFADANPSNAETDVLLAIADSTVTVLQTVYPVLAPPPAIALASPLDGSAVTGVVDLTATTAATGAVQYLVDGLPFGAPVADGPDHRLAWNTGVIPNGTHWLAAQVTDANGRVGTSPVVSVTVANSGLADAIPPIVTLDDPEPNSFVSAIVAVSATVASDVPVTGVQFFADGLGVGAPLTAPPYVTTWNTQGLANGPHVLTVTATDASGLTGNSPPTTVVVNNTQPPDRIAKDVVVSVDGLEILQTPAFTTPSADEWLVAFAAYGGPATGAQTLSIGGAGLDWKPLVRSNAQPGTSEIWAAHATHTLTNASVTCAPTLVGYTGSLTVIAFGNVSGPNVVGRTSSPAGAPDVFLPGVSAGSWVFATGNDPQHSTARTPAAGQDVVHEFRDTQAARDYWVQSTSVPSSAFALVDIHDDAPTADAYNYAAVELVATKPAAVNTPPVSSIQSPAANAFYVSGANVVLAGSATDLQSPADSLALHWTVDLVFGSHVQPGFLTFDGPAASFPAADWDDGSGVHVVVKLTATDPGGLVSDTSRVTIWPEIDLAPSAVTVTPDPPLAGKPAHYAFTLANAGRMPAPASHWVLRAGAAVLAQGDAAVPANGSASLGADATLPAAGTVTLRLTADTLGAVHETDETNDVTLRSLNVAADPADVPPVAVAAATPGSGLAPLAVAFSGAASTDADGDSLSFAWAFGDGGTATGRLASHVYASAGAYAALLTVSDGRGGSDTASVPVTVTVPVVTFPLTPVLDTFDRTSGLGGNWVDQVTSFTIVSNTLAPAKNSDAFIEWTGAVFGPNQEAFVTLVTSPSTAPEQNLMLKTQGTTWSAGHIEVSYRASTQRVLVSTFTPPRTWTTRGTITGVTFPAGSQLGARATSDGSVRVYRNGALIGTVAVPQYAALGGRIGLSVSKSTASRFDNFGGGNVSPALVSTATPAALAPATPESGPPSALALSGAFPNPSRGGIALRLDLPAASDAGMRIVDVLGREVWRVPDTPFAAGRWTLLWDGRGATGPVPAGLYLAVVRAGGTSFVRRFAVVR